MSARTKPSAPCPRAMQRHPMQSPTESHFANNNNYTHSQFYPSYYGGISAAFPYQRTDSQYPLSDYGHPGYGMTNAYYNPHNPYARGNTDIKFDIPYTNYEVFDSDKIPRYASWAGQKLVAGASAGLGVHAYNWVGNGFKFPDTAHPRAA